MASKVGNPSGGLPRRGEVLVAVVNTPDELERVREERGYRIGAGSVEARLHDGWPPRWLAFYQTQHFGGDGLAICSYAEVLEIAKAADRPSRPDDSPDETPGGKTDRPRFVLTLGPLQRRSPPIVTRRRRPLLFIPTTWQKFANAAELDDLHEEGPLQDRLWAELKRLEIPAVRQDTVAVQGRIHTVAFGIYCTNGKLDVETDGDSWRSDRARLEAENRREGDLESAGWTVLRFNSHRLSRQLAAACLEEIVESINGFGGLEEGRLVPRRIDLRRPGSYQLGLFDD